MPVKKSIYYVDNKKLFAELCKHREAELEAAKQGRAPPQINTYIASSLLLIARKIGTRSCFAGYCVDTETTAATKRGWLSYDQLKIGDDILAYDVATGMQIWTPVRAIYAFDYDGLMFKVTGSTVDALVTPGHKFVTEKGLEPIDNIGVKKHLITMGEPQDVFETYEDAFVEAVGWFVTEGSYSSYVNNTRPYTSHRGSIYQSSGANPDKCARIEACLTKLGAGDYHERRSGNLEFRLRDDVMQKIVKVAAGRVLTLDFIEALSVRQRLLLIETMIDGDGWRAGHLRKTRQYVQKNREHVDAFLMLCVRAGVATHCSAVAFDTPFGRFNGYRVTLTSRKRSYMEKVDLHGGKRGVSGKWDGVLHQPTAPYRGVVWCPRTDFGTWVARRASKIYVTGNTYLDEMISDGIENCLMYGISNFDPKRPNVFAYFTQIITWAFIRRIQKEKRQQYIKIKCSRRHQQVDQLEDNRYIQPVDEADNDEFIRKFEDSMLKKKQKREEPIKEVRRTK